MSKILYVVLNKELNMSAGKAAAQAVHAAMSLQNAGVGFADNYKRTVIVLEAENSEQIRNLEEYLNTAELFSMKYIDEGVNEVSAYSITALAVEPIDHDDEEKREIFAPFKLFSGDGNSYRDAYKHLSRVANGFQLFDGVSTVDDTPRWMKKTLEFLESRI
tara:strand:- start:2134 stop:2616 length:483 start_codon:yes stop_codon:yes gene_type:complete